MENLKIATIPITIRVIEVNNKKMTISVFNQIISKDIVGSEIINDNNFEKHLLGWVSRSDNKEKALIYSINGCLYKDVFWIGYMTADFKEEKELNSDDLKKIENINVLETFLNNDNKQIFIAI